RHVEVPDRRAARRHERRRGARAARRGGQAEHPYRGDDARRRASRGGAGEMTDLWSERADDYRKSPMHAEGPDLDLVVEWCEPAVGVTALDVATGGGHVARRLRERGATVVTADPAPGMRADTTAFAEDLPFADGSFDVVACRIAAHHFADVNAAIREMARVARDRVVIEDNLFFDESSEEAERLRDPSHVRCYSEAGWEVMLDVAGVTPGKGGQDVEGIPVFNTVADAVEQAGANASLIFVPARFAADAIYEAVDAGIRTVICITEHVPVHEMLRAYTYFRPQGITMVGPNCPGVLSPGKANVGIIPAEIFSEGTVGLVSRSGTLTYQIGHELTQLGLGNSTIVGIGGDPIVGSSFIDVLEKFQADPETELV